MFRVFIRIYPFVQNILQFVSVLLLIVCFALTGIVDVVVLVVAGVGQHPLPVYVNFLHGLATLFISSYDGTQLLHRQNHNINLGSPLHRPLCQSTLNTQFSRGCCQCWQMCLEIPSENDWHAKGFLPKRCSQPLRAARCILMMCRTSRNIISIFASFS